MRGLTKVAMPQILVDNESLWTAEYLQAVASGVKDKPSRWRHPQIKSRLRDETLGKCAYCEAFVEDVAYSNVEHIIPKSTRPDLVVAWTNLTSACIRCNVAKSDYYSAGMEILNPYVDDPDVHLVFFGSLIQHGLGNSRAELTVLKLDLNRMDLVHSRTKRLESVRSVLEHWHTAPEPLKSALAAGLRKDALEGEFTRSVRVALRQYGFPLELARQEPANT